MLLLWLRHRLLDWVLWSQFPPFSWLYRAIYWLAVRAVVRSLRRQPGLTSLYLTGSLAAGGARPGLSDIDFKLFLVGRRDVATMQAINRRFLRLRRCFPMLGPPDDKGIFFLDDLTDECRAFPLVRLFFDPRFYRHRLLWGRDCLAEMSFAPLDPAAAQEVLPWRLKYWNEKVLLLFDAAAFAPPQQRYLIWKILADMGRFLQLRQPDVGVLLEREAAIAQLADVVPAPLRPLLAACQAERAAGFRAERLTGEERFGLWREVMRFMADDPASARATVVTVPRARVWEIAADPHWARLVELVPADARCTLTDFFFVPASPLDVDGYGAFARIVHLPRALRGDEYHRLKLAYRAGSLGREPLFVVDQASIAHCLWSAMTDHFFLARGGEDGFLTFVLGDGAAPLDVSRMRVRLDRLLVQARSLLDGGQLPRLGRDRFLRFFFTALTACTLADEIDRPPPGPPCLHLPGAPGALLARLRERGLSPAVDAALAGAAAALDGKPATVSWSALPQLLAQALAVAQGMRTWADVAMPPEARSRISLVLVTRNRATMLARCLTSLLAQTRPPDEWVVVDNGSTDDTAQVVQRFAATLPMRYLVEPVPGVGQARATGCAAATGDVLAFIDDDAVADPGWLAAVEQAFALDPHIGIVGGRIDPLAGHRDDFVSRAFAHYGQAAAC